MNLPPGGWPRKDAKDTDTLRPIYMYLNKHSFNDQLYGHQKLPHTIPTSRLLLLATFLCLPPFVVTECKFIPCHQPQFVVVTLLWWHWFTQIATFAQQIQSKSSSNSTRAGRCTIEMAALPPFSTPLPNAHRSMFYRAHRPDPNQFNPILIQFKIPRLAFYFTFKSITPAFARFVYLLTRMSIRRGIISRNIIAITPNYCSLITRWYTITPTLILTTEPFEHHDRTEVSSEIG